VNLLSMLKRRSPRERMAVTLGAGAAILLAGYGWLWLPLAADTARLRASLPQLRALAAQLEADAAEAKRLAAAAAPRAASATDSLAAGVEQNIAAAGLKDKVRVMALDASRAQLDTEDANFNDWIALLAAVQQARNSKVDSARVEPLAASTQVHARAVLSRPVSR
jgi:type II secretory pathway component PulM